MAELNNKVDNIATELGVLKSRLDNIEDYQHVLEEENSDLKKQVNDFERKLDEIESHSRRGQSFIFWSCRR